ncbi:NAD(P)H-hydrate dehydratase [Paenibacillus sp. TRM 82003]|uniref:NAD(P)H-hydrate dehydratase n=1 Tax=Kineococcus sp. TRM81007 TaxID=2925831 RepID=UPI001F5700B8|nr:NAD(P)H-hydrate dehydratase [Kineococcus sp. TRM81007]MCI2239853.1 NAD(P)H-hydrate dehydratase [Kineococcus sp. TRM81007]MCI3925843.1 NAD(P)H-hydrate dehydratase [Paenibacillus sp. TRM 82003]
MSPRDAAADAVTVTSAVLREWPLPPPGVGKESRGRTCVVGGSERTPGAVLLAAEAALRCGAGKLQVATTASTAPTLGVALPEALVLALPANDEGGIDPSCGAEGSELAELAQGAHAVCLGVGTVGEAAVVELLEVLVPPLRQTVVLDALGLAPVTRDASFLHHLDGRAVLTPNPQELAIVLGVDEEEVERDAAAAARELARRSRCVVAAGGGESWIAAPDGRLWLDVSGGAGLGVSGSGDVLAGIVTGLCARGADPVQAAVWACHLHGRAGDRLASSVGRLGFLARELPAEVPRVLAEIEV